MPASKKVSATLATEIALNTLQASESLRDLGTVVKATTSAVRSQIQSFREVGDTVGSYRAQVEGLGRVNEALQAKIEALKNKQQDLNVQTESGARKFEQYQSQIDRLTGTMSRNNSAISNAKDKLSDYSSGLVSLQEQYRRSNQLSVAYVDKLRAEGNEEEANQERIRQLKSNYESLAQQYAIQSQKVSELGRTVGESSNAYHQADLAMHQTATEMAKTKKEQEDLEHKWNENGAALNKLQDAYKRNNSVIDSYVDKLRAEGKQNEATAERIKQLKSNYTDLSEQYKIQKSELSNLADTVGVTDKRYQEQATQLNKTAAEMAKVKNEEKELNSSFGSSNIGLAKVKDGYNKVGESVHKAGSKVKEFAGKVAMGATAVTASTAIVGAGFVKMSGAASDLSSTYTRITNLLETGGEKTAEVTKNVSEMQKQGRDLSLKYGKSQQDIANAYEELTKRGYSSEQSLGAMKSMLQASVASGDSFKDVVSVATGALEGFGMKANDTKTMMQNTFKAVNQLAYAADMTSTGFHDLGVGFSYVASTAHTAGISFSETASALGILSNHHLEASKAGTGLREVINRLTGTMKSETMAGQDMQKVAAKRIKQKGQLREANLKLSQEEQKLGSIQDKNGSKYQAQSQKIAMQKAKVEDLTASFNALANIKPGKQSPLEAIGIKPKDLVDAKGKMKSLADVLGMIQEHTAKMGSAKRAAVFNALFGTNGQNAAMILAQNASELKKLDDQTQQSVKNNYVGRLAQKNMQTAQMAMQQFKMAGQDVGMTLSKAVLPSVTEVAESFSKFIDTTAFKSFANTVGNGLAGIGNKLSNMAKYVSHNSKAFSSLGKSIAIIIGQLGNGVWGAFKVMIQGLANVVDILTLNFHKSSKGVDNVANSLTSLANHRAALQALGATLATLWATKKMFGFVTGLGNVIKSVSETKKSFGMLSSGMQTLRNSTGLMSKAIGLLKFTPWIAEIAAVLAALVELYKHSARFRAFCHSLTSSMHSMVNGIKDALGNFQSAWEHTESGWNSFCSHVSHYTSSLAGDVGHWFSSMGNSIKSTASDMLSHTENSFSSAWDSIKSTVAAGVSVVIDKHNSMHDQVIAKVADTMGVSQRTFSNGYSTIQGLTDTFHDIVTGKWDKVHDDIVSTAQNLRDTAHDIFSSMYDRLNDMTHGALSSIKEKWDNMWDSIVSGIRHACSSVGHEVSNLVDDAIRPVNSMLKGITKGINWVLDKFGASKLSYPSIPLVHFAQGGTVGNKGQLAVVNDGIGNHYREMFATPDGQLGAFGTERNIMTFLPNGTQVLDGENSHKLATLLDIPHFKDGTKDKNLFEKIFDKGKDILEDIEDILKHPIKFLEKVLKKFLDIKSSKTWVEGLITHAPQYFAHMGEKWLKKLVNDFKKQMESSGGNGVNFGSANNPGGAGVQRWAPVIDQAAKLLGVSLSEDHKQRLLRQIATESGGNPNAHQGNIGDINNLRGTPAQGLLQFVPSTFASWSRPGHNNIFSGLDQIMAAIYCLDHGGEGGWGNVGDGHGWSNGGFVFQHTFGEIGEGNLPEVVIPLSSQKQGRALDLLTRTVNIMNQNAGRKTTITNNPNDNSGLESKLDTVIGLLANILGVNQEQLSKSNNGLNLQGLYQKQYQDQALNNYQAY